MYLDFETGTYMTPNRHFNPRLGRWTQPDPFFHARHGNLQSCLFQSGNLFAFTMNNPVRWVDPTGLFAIPPWLQPGGGLQLGPQLGPSGAIWDAIRNADGGVAANVLCPLQKLEHAKKGGGKSGNGKGGSGTGHGAGGDLSNLTAEQHPTVRPPINSISNSNAQVRGAQNAVNNAATRNPSVNNVISNAMHTNSTKDARSSTGWGTHNFNSTGGQAAAQQHFDSLNPTNVRPTPNGQAGNLQGGFQVNIHPGAHAGGAATLDIYNPTTGEHIKIRFYD